MSTPNQATVKLLKNLQTKLGKGNIDYGDMIDEVQRLNQHASTAFAKGNTVTGISVSKAAASLLDDLDNINPAIKAANKAYRREQNIIKLQDVLAKGNPSNELRKLKRHDDLFGKGFDAREMYDIEDLVDKIARFPGQALGLGRAGVQAAAESVAEGLSHPAGRILLRQLIKAPGQWSLATLAPVMTTFMRGLTKDPSVGIPRTSTSTAMPGASTGGIGGSDSPLPLLKIPR